MEKSHVYVGIVGYNSIKSLPACMRALQRQRYSHISIIVLDNNSTDTTVNFLKKNYPHVRIIESNSNLGFGRGHNTIIDSIRLKKNDYYLILNPDAILSPVYIEKLIDLTRLVHCQWVTGKLILKRTSKGKSILYSVGHALRRDGYTFNIGHGIIDMGQYEKSREIFGAPAAASLWSASAIHELKKNGYFFDPDMFMYNEDTDLDWRARNLGFTCWYTPKATAFHPGGSPDSILSLHAVRNRYLSVIKNADLHLLVIYNIPIIISHCLFRVIQTPRDGLWLTKELLIHAIPTFNKRRRQTPSMKKWFTWSENQVSGQPQSYKERFVSFRTSRKNNIST